MEYLGLIYRNDLNIMYVKGYMKINLERIVMYLANLHTSFLCNLIYPTFITLSVYIN